MGKQEQAAAGGAVRPFRMEIPDSALEDLRERLARTRWPATPAGVGWERGVPLDYLRRLAAYWAADFDWRRQEEALNELPQFEAAVGGRSIHFLHVRSPEPDALPLLLVHGWPSSPVEFLRTLAPLADPGDRGGDPGQAFHLVVPSLPGYGFSEPGEEPGWGNLFAVAQSFDALMSRLGYKRYGVHGTDVGSGVADLLTLVAADRLAGVHVSGLVAAMPFGPPLALDELEGGERERAQRFNEYRFDGIGYLHQQATRPQTLAYALNDSPVGQLAWIVEKFHEWSDPAVTLPEEAVDRDQLLTNVSIAWFTGAGATSAHATYDGVQAWRGLASSQSDPFGDAGEGPPRGVAVFPADTPIRRLMPPVARWTEHDRGGHFPAMEVPELLVEDLRAFFAVHGR